MQFEIAAVDDCGDDLEVLAEQIKVVCSEINIESRVYLFHSGEEFLTANRDHGFDITFMDICMNDMNGIETVKSALTGKSRRFIFTTTSTDYAVEAFALNAVHYLVKPTTNESVAEALKRCIQTVPEKSGKILNIKFGKFVIPVPTDEILFIEVTDKLCTVHTEKNQIDTHTSLGALYALLDSNIFIRPQQSYVVNMNYIDSFFFDHIVLRNGKEITLSRNGRAELKERYQSFLFRLARGDGV